jgi:predicted HicB family RNase H-like nuclease
MGKNVNSTTISVRVPHELAAVLRRRAQVQGQSLNSWLLTLLENEAKLANETRGVRQ